MSKVSSFCGGGGAISEARTRSVVNPRFSLATFLQSLAHTLHSVSLLTADSARALIVCFESDTLEGTELLVVVVTAGQTIMLKMVIKVAGRR